MIYYNIIYNIYILLVHAMCWALDFLTPLPDLESAPGFRKAGASAGHPMSLEMPWSQSQTESEREREILMLLYL